MQLIFKSRHKHAIQVMHTSHPAALILNVSRYDVPQMQLDLLECQIQSTRTEESVPKSICHQICVNDCVPPNENGKLDGSFRVFSMSIPVLKRAQSNIWLTSKWKYRLGPHFVQAKTHVATFTYFATWFQSQFLIISTWEWLMMKLIN